MLGDSVRQLADQDNSVFVGLRSLDFTTLLRRFEAAREPSVISI